MNKKVTVAFCSRGKFEYKKFNSVEDVVSLLEANRYIYDEVEDYYWKVDPWLGTFHKAWVVK